MKPPVNMELKREFAVRLKELRLESGMNQQQFADAIGVSRVHINRLEAPEAEKMPSHPFITRVCQYVGVNEDWLYYGKGKKYTRDSEIEILANERTAELSASIVNQTTDYIHLKSSELLKKGNLTAKQFVIFFKLFSSVMEMTFKMMAEIKNALEKNNDPLKFVDSYSKEFRSCLTESMKEVS